MNVVTYAMRFTGQATPSPDKDNVLQAVTTSPSMAVTSTVKDGLSSNIDTSPGSEARFTSEVDFSSETVFTETGSITFGDGNRIDFSTVGEGDMSPSADPSLQQGTVMWQVDGGTGQFAGASGRITSNFFVDGNGAVTDHQFGVIFVR